jgi:hypothetical protein
MHELNSKIYVSVNSKIFFSKLDSNILRYIDYSFQCVSRMGYLP